MKLIAVLLLSSLSLAQSVSVVSRINVVDQAGAIPNTVIATPSSDTVYRISAYIEMQRLGLGLPHASDSYCLFVKNTGSFGVATQMIGVRANQTYTPSRPAQKTLVVDVLSKAGTPLSYWVAACTVYPVDGTYLPYNLSLITEQMNP